MRRALVAGAPGDRCTSLRFILCAGCKKLQQHGVAFAFEFLDRAAIGLFGDTFDDVLRYLGAELCDRPKIFPPRGHRPGELLEEMMDSTRTAAEMEQEIW